MVMFGQSLETQLDRSPSENEQGCGSNSSVVQPQKTSAKKNKHNCLYFISQNY